MWVKFCETCDSPIDWTLGDERVRSYVVGLKREVYCGDCVEGALVIWSEVCFVE